MVSFSLRPLYTPGKISGAHWIAVWMGPRTGPDTVENRHLSQLPEIEHRCHGHPVHKPTELHLASSLSKSIDLLDTFRAFFEEQQAQVKQVERKSSQPNISKKSRINKRKFSFMTCRTAKMKNKSNLILIHNKLQQRAIISSFIY
jgi:hypothetical protein